MKKDPQVVQPIDAGHGRTGRLVADLTNRVTQPAWSGPAARDQRVAAVLEAILGRYEGKLALRVLGDELGVSCRYLGRLIRRETGRTFKQCLREWRVFRAAELLARGVSPKEAAGRAGYSNASNFGRDFLSFTGITPGDYQRAAMKDAAT